MLAYVTKRQEDTELVVCRNGTIDRERAAAQQRPAKAPRQPGQRRKGLPSDEQQRLIAQTLLESGTGLTHEALMKRTGYSLSMVYTGMMHLINDGVAERVAHPDRGKSGSRWLYRLRVDDRP